MTKMMMSDASRQNIVPFAIKGTFQLGSRKHLRLHSDVNG